MGSSCTCSSALRGGAVVRSRFGACTTGCRRGSPGAALDKGPRSVGGAGWGDQRECAAAEVSSGAGASVLTSMSVVRDPDPGGQSGDGGSEESALVAQAVAGDHEALGVLVTRYAPSVRRVTRAILGDVVEAEDAAQDGLLLALLKLDQFDRTRAFGPWLMRVVGNAAIDRGRRRRIRRTRPLEDDVAASTPLPDVQAERRASRQRLAPPPPHLPHRHRSAIALFDVEGYSHGENSEMLGVARGTARSAVC